MTTETRLKKLERRINNYIKAREVIVLLLFRDPAEREQAMKEIFYPGCDSGENLLAKKMQEKYKQLQKEILGIIKEI
jgi:hypothetical protein